MPKGSDLPQASPFVAAAQPGAATATRVSGEPWSAPVGLKLPSVAAINESLHALIGDQASVREKRPVTFSPNTLGPCWVSRLIDDEGHEVGAIVADRAATIALGGALMSLPEQELEPQRALVTPSDDILGAMSEVANNLCETINQQAGSGHQVRVKPIEPLAPGALDWAAKVVDRGLACELRGQRGPVILVRALTVISRPHRPRAARAAGAALECGRVRYAGCEYRCR